MPCAIVARCASARFPSGRSAITISLPVAKTCSGILRLVSNRAPPSDRHDEPALGARDVNRRIHHEGEDLVQHAAAAQAAERLEQRGNLAKSADKARRTGARSGIRQLVVHQEEQLCAGRPSDLNPVAVRQTLFGDLRSVDVGAAARPAVADQVLSVSPQDLGVIAGDVGAGQLQVVDGSPPYGEGRLVEDDDPASLHVGDFEPGVWHGADARIIANGYNPRAFSNPSTP